MACPIVPDLVGAPETEPAPPRLTVVPYADSDLAEWTELYGLFRRMNADEREVVLAVARQYAGRGRSEYGALNLETDERDFGFEAEKELHDAAGYIEMALRKLMHMRRGK